jgi:hypothetical protein
MHISLICRFAGVSCYIIYRGEASDKAKEAANEIYNNNDTN